MELLLSNIPPVKSLKHSTAVSRFENLMRSADGMKIASGYISADAIIELKRMVEVNKKSFLELIIGMHHFDGFTRSQFHAAQDLDECLKDKAAGSVKVVSAFRFHGKVYSFLKKEIPFAGIIGSSNLSSILDSQNYYEADLFVDDSGLVKQIDGFITDLSKGCTLLSKYTPTLVEDDNRLLEGHDRAKKVEKSELSEVFSKRVNLSFKIPIKTDEAPKSSLNVYFGKGRSNNKGDKPRHWYETELMVPSTINKHPQYPKKGKSFTVYTDDGWTFDCKTSGDNSKNFRSAGDLDILGKWIKGRLENYGVLKMRERVTKKTLEEYGRDNFELIATDNPDIWLLDFKSKR